MRKKIKRCIISCLFAACLCLLPIACQQVDDKEEPLAEQLEGFDVLAEDSVEIGEYYVPSMPTVTLDGERVHVSVSATQNGTALYFNGKDALLVESFEDIELLYTVQENDERVEKKTILKVQDTGKPYIITNLPAYIYRGETFILDEYVRFVDLSGQVEESATVITDQDGNNISLENGAFTLSEGGLVTMLNFAFTATDFEGNTQEKSVSVPVKEKPYHGVMEMAALNVATDVATYNEAVNFSNEDGLLSFTTAKGTGGVILKRPSWIAGKADGWASAFDTFTVTIEMVSETDENDNVTGWRLYDKKTSSFISCVDANGETPSEQFVNVGDKITYTVSMADVTSWQQNATNKFALYLKRQGGDNTEGDVATFKISDITFAYGEKKIEESTVIGYDIFGLEAGDVVSAIFKPTNGEAETVDLSSYVPETSGELTLTIKTAASRTTTFVLSVVCVQNFADSDSSKDTDVAWDW